MVCVYFRYVALYVYTSVYSFVCIILYNTNDMFVFVFIVVIMFAFVCVCVSLCAFVSLCVFVSLCAFVSVCVFVSKHVVFYKPPSRIAGPTAASRAPSSRPRCNARER